MPLATLLNPDDPWFAFEHANAHRNLLGVMSPLTRFSVLPYFLDPLGDVNTSASGWRFDHQQAHNDTDNQLPETFTSQSLGFSSSANLVDSNLADPWNRSWWTHTNHMEHYVDNNTVLPQTDLYYEVTPDPIPNPTPPPPTIQPPPYWVQYRTWTFPFW